MTTSLIQEKSISDELVIILILRAQIRMTRDDSPLGANEILVDWLDDLKVCLIELKKSSLDSNTPNLYLGLLGEFAFSRWLEVRGIVFDHRTRSNPSELLTDFIAEDLTPNRNTVKLSIDQFESIPTHSEILVWTFYSSWRNSVTIDSWTPVSMLNECKIKSVSAPPDFALTNDPAIELDFTETIFVYEVPSFIMFDIGDLEMRLKGYGGGVQSVS